MNFPKSQKYAASVLVIVAAVIVTLYFSSVQTSNQMTENFGTSTSATTTTETTEQAKERQVKVREFIKEGNDAYASGNYLVARKSWESALELAPLSTNILVSLGQLNASQFKDYAKAEDYLIRATKNLLPGRSTNTFQILLDFYQSTGFKSDTNVYELTLKNAIKENPQAVEFYVLLARRYKEAGRTAEAKTQFNAAIKAAGSNTPLVAQLEAERDSF